MKENLFWVFSLAIAVMACSSVKKAYPSTSIREGITGRVTELTGNQMPMRGSAPAQPNGVQTTVYIYTPTTLQQVTRIGSSPAYTAIATTRVASVETDSTGVFRIALPPGAYSLFIKQGDHFYANLFNQLNQIALFTVKPGEMTTANLTISSGAHF
jgi:hypothetical protein